MQLEPKISRAAALVRRCRLERIDRELRVKASVETVYTWATAVLLDPWLRAGQPVFDDRGWTEWLGVWVNIEPYWFEIYAGL